MTALIDPRPLEDPAYWQVDPPELPWQAYDRKWLSDQGRYQRRALDNGDTVASFYEAVAEAIGNHHYPVEFEVNAINGPEHGIGSLKYSHHLNSFDAVCYWSIKVPDSEHLNEEGSDVDELFAALEYFCTIPYEFELEIDYDDPTP